MPAIYREIGKRYAVASFLPTGWPRTGALGVCYCESCQKIYREKVGGVPPEQTDATSPLYRRYYAAFMDRLLEVWRLWDAVARESRPDAVYVGNLGGGIRVVNDLARIGQVAGWLNVDHQGRSADTPPRHCAQLRRTRPLGS